MSSTIQKLSNKKLINPPKWLPNAVQWEVISGSIAYGISSNSSDYDLYAFCIPKKEMVFDHLSGHIPGFGKQIKRFEQYQQHHIVDENEHKEYDIQCFSIIKYFQLVMEGNPNCVDTLFIPRECILFSTKIGELVRENRRLFLHKGCYHKFRGYAFGQISRATNAANSDEVKAIREFEEEYNIPHNTTYQNFIDNPNIITADISDIYHNLWENGFKKTKRFENQKIYGADTKFLAHLVRLCSECEQILVKHDLDLRYNKEKIRAVRDGELTLEQAKKWFADQEIYLEELYHKSTLPYGPDETKIKQLLLKCLEEYFGSLDKCIVNLEKEKVLLQQIAELSKDYL